MDFQKWTKTLLFQEFYLVKIWSAVKTLLNRGTLLFEGYENGELTVLLNLSTEILARKISYPAKSLKIGSIKVAKISCKS